MMLNSERILTNQEFRELLNGSLGSLEKSPVARFAKAGDTCVRMDLATKISRSANLDKAFFNAS